jgi:hypothetical protein
MDELSRPGYLHVVLNHLPILGMPFGLFGFGVALLLRSRPGTPPTATPPCLK